MLSMNVDNECCQWMLVMNVVKNVVMVLLIDIFIFTLLTFITECC